MADARAVRLLEAIYARMDKQMRDVIASMIPPGGSLSEPIEGNAVTPMIPA